MTGERPKVFINCAMTADGKIALPSGKQLKISGEEDFARVHQLRHQAGAVVVGVGTVLSDDPKLTVKEKFVPEPSQPLRVVLDSRLRTPLDAQVLSGAAPTLLATTVLGMKVGREKLGKLAELEEKQGQRIMVLAFGEDQVDVGKLVAFLGSKGHDNVFVEGGGSVMMSFLRAGLVDEYFVYVGSRIVGGEGTPVPFTGRRFQEEGLVVRLELEDATRLDDGVLLKYRVLKG